MSAPRRAPRQGSIRQGSIRQGSIRQGSIRQGSIGQVGLAWTPWHNDQALRPGTTVRHNGPA
ncbi:MULTISPECIES: hypothetical protein [unclassified Microbispora]|uniref:hypothetical protein n=1 Tax=unclassified Microbispora TaxID=2614687 RepID=UPI00143BFAAA|nr:MULTISPECIES: hypothetical protein [unclassified Microbispora]NJP28528.1 hypothetical protein [Microbispora sp. CL1-1]